MANLIATTKMSSKGQVVIPEALRRQLGLQTGCQFLVLGEKDTVILKTISAPSPKEFSALLTKARNAARQAGLTTKDIAGAIRKARSDKRR